MRNMSDILKKFISELEDGDSDSISVNDMMSKQDKFVYEKWVQIFNIMNPFSIKQGANLISSSLKMSKRDDIVLLSYIKFFESKLQHMKDDATYMSSLMANGKKVEIVDDRKEGGGMFG